MLDYHTHKTGSFLGKTDSVFQQAREGPNYVSNIPRCSSYVWVFSPLRYCSVKYCSPSRSRSVILKICWLVACLAFVQLIFDPLISLQMHMAKLKCDLTGACGRNLSVSVSVCVCVWMCVSRGVCVSRGLCVSLLCLSVRQCVCCFSAVFGVASRKSCTDDQILSSF